MDHIKKHQELIKGQIYNSYNALEKSEDNDIEKGGAGSRGGKVVGYTRSGKPIYDSPDHESHKNYTAADHYDAGEHHIKDAIKHEDSGDQEKHDAAKDKYKKHEAERRVLRRKEKYDSLKDSNEESRTKTFEKLVRKRRSNDEDEDHHNNLHDHIAANHGEDAAHHFSENFDPTEHTMKHAKQILKEATAKK